MESRTGKKILIVAVKIAVSSLLLAFIIKKVGTENVLAQFRSMDLRFFLLSSFLYVVIMLLAAMRWRLLLEEEFPLRKLFSLNCIGSFFNNLLPGAIGGDGVKIYYLYKDTGKGGVSLGSVFLDRYIGSSALFTIGLMAGLYSFSELRQLGMQWVIPLLFLAFLVVSVLVFAFKFGRRFPVLADFYDYFNRSIRGRRRLAKAFLLSLLIQLVNFSMVYVVARGIGQKLSFTALFVFLPIIITVMMVPISISGLGLRESAFVVLFGLTGVPADTSVSISFLWFLSIAVASLGGLIEYVRYGKKDRRLL